MLINLVKPKFHSHIQDMLASADIQTNGDRPWDLQIHNPDVYQRILREGLLGLGESYVEGWWDCPNLDEFFTKIFRSNLYNLVDRDLATVLETAKAKLWNMQSLNRSFQIGKHHYDLGNELYQLMLDSRMTYTCGYWKTAQNLEDAQAAKLDLICQKLQLKKGMTLLDIGCGWGSLMKYAAEKYEVSCVGLTVSQEQIKLGEELCKGLPVKFILQDYRQFDEQFDRVASVGMIEHVGHKNYRVFMEKVNCCLKNNGLFLLHTIGSNYTEFYIDRWINKYIFPNALLPSAAQICASAEKIFVVEDWHNFGQYYDPTLMAWWHNFDNNWGQLADKYGDEFYRMWKYYLLMSAGAFRSRHIQVWQIMFSKNGILGGYPTVR
ncbi:cyclopropane fatty acyl phospholipid synthase [Chamaesiphon minutus]|uniref:Methyltransferase, cyclopropane fatty acid synthase n=1 Tax=Chamaesiphon minutus (strain ATCC 27169 / PCC 6605) TaxID=1173020 RepID=K9UPC0_CHAP6|nr:cyclopropane fatty acyl phospholipid synthase [Chamaesiphon minutus]AFY96937.1 methyltransferase, cyclopropane fatty acid synthase [Chamaesiphon minutus PCC 6605]